MRIAISADNNDGLDSVVSPHFGRCPHFVLVDMDGQEVKAVSVIDNPYYGNHRPGQVPGFINSHGVNVMLTGGMGRRAIMFFEQFGIQPVTGAAGTVRQSLERYLGGALQGAAPCRESLEHAHEHDDGAYEKDEVGRLREEAEMLRQQLDEAITRLDRLEKSS
jgi:predicted Fe-Mo cluster-binding NifX family protein